MSWKRFWYRRRRDTDFEQEVASYLQHETDRNIDSGMNPVEARAAALRKFGNVMATKERVHEMNSIGWLETFLRDLRHGLRWLRLNPVFAAVAILSLALGIGANTAIFQLIDAVRIRALPVANPQELAEVRLAPPRARTGNFTSRRPELTYPIWERLRDRQQTFSGLFAWSTATFDLSSGGEARNAEGLWVSGDFFDVLHISPERGRLLSTADDVRGCAAAGVVISHGFWQREFGGLDSALGKQISLDGKPFEVVGVTPQSFFGMEVGRNFDVALPLCARGLWPGHDAFTNRMQWWLAVAGRLKGGVTIEQAAADVRGISAGIFSETVEPTYTAGDSKSYQQLKLTTQPVGTGVSQLRAQYETPLWILLATTAVVLLIACANIANLMLARANARHREISIRLAIGASRGRLVRQLLAESALLAAIGAALGLFLARGLSRFLVVFLDSETEHFTLPLQMDWRILLYTSALVVTTCLIFGLVPALRGTRVGPGAALKTSGRGLTSDRQRFGMRRALVVSQVALSLTLLVGSLLFARSLQNLVNLDSGYRPAGALFVRVDLQRLRVDTARRDVLFTQILDGLKTLPPVEVAAAISQTPLIDGWNNNVRAKTDATAVKYVLSNFNRVGTGYFKAIGTTLIAGREFNKSDTTSSSKVALVDQTFVEKVFHGTNPIGSRFELDSPPGKTAESFEIVGIVQNVKYNGLRTDFTPTAYLADTQQASTLEMKRFVIRSSASLLPLIAGITETIRRVDPAIGIQFQSFDTIVRDSLISERLMATLSSFFGLLAALLATIGLYGTLSYTVTQRRNEIGIRIALGANRRQVVRMILGEAAILLGLGLTLGTITTLYTTRTASTLLFGLRPNDPISLATGVVSLGAITLLASYLPARRAAKLEPTTVLREE